VFAAVAAALTPGVTIDEVIDAALAVAHDGTRAAIADVAAAARGLARDADQATVQQTLRSAVRPYDTVGDDYRTPDLDARRPSRTKSIEGFPVALGFCLHSGGDFRAAVLGAVNYRGGPGGGRGPTGAAGPTARPTYGRHGRRIGADDATDLGAAGGPVAAGVRSRRGPKVWTPANTRNAGWPPPGGH
jgi:hypothetical protein